MCTTVASKITLGVMLILRCNRRVWHFSIRQSSFNFNWKGWEQSWYSVGPEPIPEPDRTGKLAGFGRFGSTMVEFPIDSVLPFGRSSRTPRTDRFPISTSGIGSVLWNGIPDKYRSVLGVVLVPIMWYIWYRSCEQWYTCNVMIAQAGPKLIIYRYISFFMLQWWLQGA